MSLKQNLTPEAMFAHVSQRAKPPYVRNKQVHIKPKTIALYLATAITLLLIAHLAALYFLSDAKKGVHFAAALNKHFNLNNERNIPTLYAGFQLICSSLLSLLVYSIYKKKNIKQKHYWLTLSAIFFYMGLDEVAQIHERINNAFQGLFANSQLHYVFWPWIVTYCVLALGTGLYFLRFLLMLRPKTRNLFILAGSIYIMGALVLEFVGNEFFDGSDSLFIWTTITIEEICELTGIAIFIYAVFDYITPLTLEIGIDKDEQQ